MNTLFAFSGGMLEVGTRYSGWSGAQLHGRCVCLC